MALNRSVAILLVDDSNTVIGILRKLLSSLGFDNIDDASNVVSALELLAYKRYGLIISDWNMGNLSGFDLLRQVRTDRQHVSVPFIMITSEMSTENVIAAKSAGVSGYIIKPFSAEALNQKIEAIFAAQSIALLERSENQLSPEVVLV